MTAKVILDTDIGDDIDDALALGLICASPELQLLGVTTVFGNVVERGRQARTVLTAAGQRFRDIPVMAGCSATMASRRPKPDENGPLSQEPACFPEDQLPPMRKAHAVQFLIDTIMSGDGDIIPITIGAMTNLAAAMVLERRILKKLPRIISMAAEFRHPFAEWNILCDPEAAHLVFSSGVPVTVITWNIGNQAQFVQYEIERLAKCDRPLAKNLTVAIAAWRSASLKHHPDPMPSLFDPMAVATIMRPDLCTWKKGTVKVELTGTDTYGFTTFKEHADGPHTVAWDVNRQQAIDFVLDRIMAVG